MTQIFKQLFKIYLNTDKRIGYKITVLISALEHAKNPYHQISKRMKKTSKPLKLLKCLIFLHQCYYQNKITNQQSIIALLTQIAKNRTNIKNQLDNIICTQVLPQYILYLQKCIQYNMQAKQQFFCQTEPQQIYRQINILKYAVDFIDVLYIFGRYFSQLLYVKDFNIIIAKDVRIKYDHLRQLFIKNSNHKLLDDGIKLDLQKIHEKMYIIYYNCYYYKETKCYQPLWIDTHNQSSTKSTSTKKSRQLQSTSSKTRKSSILKPSNVNKLSKQVKFDQKIRQNTIIKYGQQMTTASSISKSYKSIKNNNQQKQNTMYSDKTYKSSKRASQTDKVQIKQFTQQQNNEDTFNIQKIKQNVSQQWNGQQTFDFYISKVQIAQNSQDIDCISQDQDQQISQAYNLIQEFQKVIKIIDENNQQMVLNC